MSQIKATDSFVCFTGLNFLFTCFDIAFGFSVLHLAWPELDVMNGKGHNIYWDSKHLVPIVCFAHLF